MLSKVFLGGLYLCSEKMTNNITVYESWASVYSFGPFAQLEAPNVTYFQGAESHRGHRDGWHVPVL